MADRPLVRVAFPDETSWAEHVEGDIYRSLNDCLNGVPLALPADAAGLPEGHPGPERNGMRCRLHWGHLFRGREIRVGVVEPLAIVGYDAAPRPEVPRG